MGIMVSKKDDVTDELSRRINADLREKMNATSKQVGDKDDPDYVEDSDYVRDLKKTSKYSWIWILVGIVVVAVLVVVGITLGGQH